MRSAKAQKRAPRQPRGKFTGQWLAATGTVASTSGIPAYAVIARYRCASMDRQIGRRPSVQPLGSTALRGVYATHLVGHA